MHEPTAGLDKMAVTVKGIKAVKGETSNAANWTEEKLPLGKDPHPTHKHGWKTFL